MYVTKYDLIEKIFGTQMQNSTNSKVLLPVFQVKTCSRTKIFWGILGHAMEHLNFEIKSILPDVSNFDLIEKTAEVNAFRLCIQ